jgi:hypothetical protein
MNAMAPNQALQQTAGHDSFLRLQAHRCPAAAELGRSAHKTEKQSTIGVTVGVIHRVAW